MTSRSLKPSECVPACFCLMTRAGVWSVATTQDEDQDRLALPGLAWSGREDNKHLSPLTTFLCLVFTLLWESGSHPEQLQ